MKTKTKTKSAVKINTVSGTGNLWGAQAQEGKICEAYATIESTDAN